MECLQLVGLGWYFNDTKCKFMHILSFFQKNWYKLRFRIKLEEEQLIKFPLTKIFYSPFWGDFPLRVCCVLCHAKSRDKNNYPLGKDVSVSIVVGKSTVLVTLSSTERPVKHEQFNFSLSRQGFKTYSPDQNFLLSILSLTCQILFLTRQILSRSSKLSRSTVVSDATR